MDFKSKHPFNWKVLGIVLLVALLIRLFMGISWAQPYAGLNPQERKQLMDDLTELRQKINAIRESSMITILIDCDRNYMEFYYCSMARMYAMQHVLRHFQSFVDDAFYETRPLDEVADDFEKLNELMESWMYTTADGETTFSFIEILDEYEEYLETK